MCKRDPYAKTANSTANAFNVGIWRDSHTRL